MVAFHMGPMGSDGLGFEFLVGGGCSLDFGLSGLCPGPRLAGRPAQRDLAQDATVRRDHDVGTDAYTIRVRITTVWAAWLTDCSLFSGSAPLR